MTVFSSSVLPINKNFLTTCVCQALPPKVLHLLRGIRKCLIFKVVYSLTGKGGYKSQELQTQVLQQQSRKINEWGGSKFHSTQLF